MKSHTLSQKYDMNSLRLVQHVEDFIYSQLTILYGGKDPYNDVDAEFDVLKLLQSDPSTRRDIMVRNIDICHELYVEYIILIY